MRLTAVRGAVATLAASLVVSGSALGSSPAYELPVWFNWAEKSLDVVIVPPAHGQLVNGGGVLNGSDPAELTPFNSYLEAIEDSIAAWDSAIAQFGSEWLKANVKTNVYVLGRDEVPMDVLRDPEILVVTDENKGTILGVAVSTNPCIVDNSKMMVTSFSYPDMFNINAQEYGHCLGVHHVLKPGPEHDTMNGTYADTIGRPDTHLHCPSNLDIAAVEMAFTNRSGNASIPADSYQLSTC